MHKWLSDTGRILAHTWRLLLCGRETRVLIGIGLVLLFVMLFSMDEVKEEKSRILVGVVDEDGSEFSQRVISRLKALDGYEVTEGEKDKLLLELAEGSYAVVCVIKKGYEEKVMGADTDDLVYVYETQQKALLFTDVLAGAMIQEICSAKSYLTFAGYMKEKNGVYLETPEEYRTYMETYFSDSMFDFSFDVEYVSVDGEESKKPGNDIIYLQAILATAALILGFLSVYAAMPYYRLCHGKVADRMKTLPYQKSALLFGSALGCIGMGMGFATVFLLTLTIRNRLTVSAFLAFLVCTLGYLCVIVGIVFLTATVIRSQQRWQMTMVALILVFGVFGLVSIADGLILPEGISTWVPNGRYVREMTEIYQK